MKIVLLLTSISVLAQTPEVPTSNGTKVHTPVLTGVTRVFVDKLTGGENAAQMRDLLIGALQRTGRISVTENPDRADHYLRGAAEDLIFQDQFDSSDSLNARAFSSRGSKSRSITNGAVEVGVGQNESTHIKERKHEAMASVRLVTKDGDVIWSTTQESLGAKFRSASADVAEKVVKQLVLDLDNPKLPSQ